MKKPLLAAIILASVAVNAQAQKYRVTIETDMGKIKGMLYNNTTLNTSNMVKLAREHSYDSTLFHRVIPEFMIQGGDPDSKTAKPGQALGGGGLKYTVPAEINDLNYHKKGAFGVARDNNPTKAGSAMQFYIVVGKKFTDAELDALTARSGRKFSNEQREVYKTMGGTPHLDGNYTVFGEVTEGQEIVDKIAAQERDRNDRPNNDIRILSIRVKKKFLFFK